MKKHYTDEKTGISYTLHGDYYLPDLALPAEERISVGVWGLRHKEYLKKYKRRVFDDLFFSGKMNAYLAQVDQNAQDMFDLLIRQFADQEGVTEKLKSEDQWLWIQKMGNIRNRAMEIVNHEVIYV